MTEKTAYIYRVTNMLNGMNYIGVSTNPKRRFVQHCRKSTSTRFLLKNAIQKYGKDSFRLTVLFTSTQKHCYEMEKVYISAYRSLTPNGYNLAAGGMGSLGLSGAVNGCFGRKGELHPHYGKPGYFKGRKHSEETKAKMRAARLGRKHTNETKAKIGAASKRNFADQVFMEKMKAVGFCVGRPQKSRRR